MKARKEINLGRWICQCLHCGKKWVSKREIKPKSCPKCRTPRWETEPKWRWHAKDPRK